ncbi:MAG: hypothetical protein GF350_09890 [Chitinivibrionales bacterium]|nr:hypothetical protein [Chitinivibrionales bacterium]
MKSGFTIAAAALLALIMVSGDAGAAENREKNQGTQPAAAGKPSEDTGTVKPAPVVDDTPIDPGIIGPHADSSAKTNDTAGHKVQRKNRRKKKTQ